MSTRTVSLYIEKLLAITKEGNVYFAYPPDSNETTLLEGLDSKAVSVSVSEFGGLILTETGTVYTVFINGYCGPPRKLKMPVKIKMVAMGDGKAALLSHCNRLVEINFRHGLNGNLVAMSGRRLDISTYGDVISLESYGDYFIMITSQGVVLKWKNEEQPKKMTGLSFRCIVELMKMKGNLSYLSCDDQLCQKFDVVSLEWKWGSPVRYFHPLVLTDSGNVVINRPRTNCYDLLVENISCIFPTREGERMPYPCVVLDKEGALHIIFYEYMVETEYRVLRNGFPRLLIKQILNIPPVKEPILLRPTTNRMSKLKKARMGIIYGIWRLSLSAYPTFVQLPWEIVDHIFSYL